MDRLTTLADLIDREAEIRAEWERTGNKDLILPLGKARRAILDAMNLYGLRVVRHRGALHVRDSLGVRRLDHIPESTAIEIASSLARGVAR